MVLTTAAIASSYVLGRVKSDRVFAQRDQETLKEFLEAFVKGKVTHEQIREVRDILSTPTMGEAGVFTDHFSCVAAFLPKRRCKKTPDDKPLDKYSMPGTTATRKEICEPLFKSLRRMKKITDESFLSRHL